MFPYQNTQGTQLKIDYSEVSAQTEGKSKDELKMLLDDSFDIGAYIKCLPQVKLLNDKKEELIIKNKEIAEDSLSQQPDIYEKHQGLLTKKGEAVELIEAIKKLKFKLVSASGNYSPDILYSLLQVASMEAEDKSNIIVDRFLEKETADYKDVDEFIEDFVNVRKVCHLRTIKLNKCRELLEINRSRRSKSSSPIRRAPHPPSTNTAHIVVQSPLMLTPDRKAPPPPRSKSASPNKQRIRRNK